MDRAPRPSLYDLLRGRTSDGRPTDGLGDEERYLASVLGNLHRLFNTRRGAVAHLPDYGLPEAAIIYRDANFPIEELRSTIEASIRQYEPRLRRVRVVRQPDADDDVRIAFLITAETAHGQPVRLQTRIATNDLVEVNPWTRRD